MEEKEFKCEFCDKEFTRENNKITHQNVYCKKNPDSDKSIELIDLEINEVYFAETPIEVIESKYNANEQFVIDYFKGRSLKNIVIPPADKHKIYDAYVALTGKDYNKDCNFQGIHAFTTLWYRRAMILKRK